MYEGLTKFLAEFKSRDFGKIVSEKYDGTSREIPHVCYSKVVTQFIESVHEFVGKHKELQDYSKILEDNSIEWSTRAMKAANVDKLDAQCVLALLVAAVRAERFCDGALLDFFDDGAISRWLERLKRIDINRSDFPQCTLIF